MRPLEKMEGACKTTAPCENLQNRRGSFGVFFIGINIMAWRIAESLKQLRAQINEQYPNRDKSSDGGIGDAAHASRNSDHNPWVKDKHGVGVVTAIDIDEDLASNIHSIEAIVSAIRASKDPRVKYIIYEKRITVAGSDLQRWKPYTGKNPHDHHAHISVNSDPKLYDSTKPWSLGFDKAVKETVKISAPAPAATANTPAEILPESSDETPEAGATPLEQNADQIINTGDITPPVEDKPFIQYIPDAAKDKSLWLRIVGGISLANVTAWVSGIPDWAKFVLGAILGIALWQFGKLIISNREKVWAFVTEAMHLKSDPTRNSPVLTTDKTVLDGETIPTSLMRRDLRAELVAEIGEEPETKYQK